MSSWLHEAWYESSNHAPTVFVEVVLVQSARVEHTCTTCRRPIEPGESYRREVGMTRGSRPYVVKEHNHCG